ncbi:MAG TPA: Maf family nucleotide pyrophosphatase [Gammaproteobacteria bacterium]|nr:Maf family nucleotide pyrophosphatase [Gammaproteobacteria bacterium]
MAFHRRLLLASTSPYRRELLGRLDLPFETLSPEVDEQHLPGEPAAALVGRLAEAKARAGATAAPDALVIGSDQVAVLEDAVLGKPGTHGRAVEQLTRLSGREVEFLTGLCLLDGTDGSARTEVVSFRVQFRTLTGEQIQHYLRRETPYNCAGSFKSEGLGIALFERMEGDDPTALVGLPLITLCTLLARAGVDVLTADT